MSSVAEALGPLTSRLDFAAFLDDHERLLKVTTALPALALLPEHLLLREGLNEPFELVLDCVSTSAHFELKRLLGEQMTVSLKHADGRYLPWHGYVAQAAQLGSDGGLARYRLTMGPWPAHDLRSLTDFERTITARSCCRTFSGDPLPVRDRTQTATGDSVSLLGSPKQLGECEYATRVSMTSCNGSDLLRKVS